MFWVYFGVFLCACAAAGTTGGMFPPGEWYRALKKPTWTPPDWAVSRRLDHALPVHVGRGRARREHRWQRVGAGALVTAESRSIRFWTPIFFGLQRIKGGMMVLAALWLSVAACMVALWSLDWIAGLLFLPYLAWVTTGGRFELFGDATQSRSCVIAPIRSASCVGAGP